MHVEVPSIKYNALSGKEKGEASVSVKERVHQARDLQKKRFGSHHTICNARMTEKQIHQFCQIDEEAYKLIEMAVEKLGLSARAVNRVLKVSRTIADLENSESIRPSHVAEAIQYRSLDRSLI